LRHAIRDIFVTSSSSEPALGHFNVHLHSWTVARMASQVADNGSLANPVHLPQLDTHNLLPNGLTTEKTRQASGSSHASSSEAAMRKKNLQGGRAKAYSSSSRNTHSTSSTQAENRAAQRAVRTLPRKIALHSHHDEQG